MNMKKTLLLAAALACSGAVAQEKEIWACQGVESQGFVYRSNDWDAISFINYNLTLTLDPITLQSYSYVATLDIIGKEYGNKTLLCKIEAEQLYYVEFLHCNLPEDDPRTFSLNMKTGKAIFSDTLSFMDNDLQENASIDLSIFQCTKF
jgi:hypothetical protein